ncbi:hypothetical protein ACFLYS_03345 [Chloroflexota bacterium]
MTKHKFFSLGFIFVAAMVIAVVWWLYQPAVDPFTLQPEMDLKIIHASPGLEEGCGVCHADALVADDDTCKSCHTESENIPPTTFTGQGTGSTFNLPHHLLSSFPPALDPTDPLYNADSPGCVDEDCHASMATDARYTSIPDAVQTYCHDPACHATMVHMPAP